MDTIKQRLLFLPFVTTFWHFFRLSLYLSISFFNHWSRFIWIFAVRTLFSRLPSPHPPVISKSLASKPVPVARFDNIDEHVLVNWATFWSLIYRTSPSPSHVHATFHRAPRRLFIEVSLLKHYISHYRSTMKTQQPHISFRKTAMGDQQSSEKWQH